MGLQWFLLLLFCFLYDWLFANGSDSLKEINGTKLPDPMIQKNQMAQAAVTWITADTKNNTNNMTILTSSMPLQVQHASSPTALAGIVQVVSVKTAQTSTRQVVLTSTNRQQEHLGLQTSSGFADISSPVQWNNQDNGNFNNRENFSVSRDIVNRMNMKTAFTEIGDFDEPEDTHFLYYIVVFGTVIVCLYVASHNKKKILGFIIEGRRPSSSTRRAAHRYRRLSQHDDNGFDPMNIIKR